MFNHIMVPVDLAHSDRLEAAARVAADLAKHYDAHITYVGVTSTQPGPVAHSPEEFATKLAQYAATRSELDGVPNVTSHPITAHDPAVEIDRALEQAVHDTGADLVVMASHIPKRFEFGSHGGRVASHTDVSVMLIRS